MTNNATRLMGRPQGLLRRRAPLIASIAVLTVAGLLDAALLRDSADSSDYALIAVLGLLIGLGLGVVIAFVWDRYSGRLKSVSDVEAATGLPVLERIPTLQLNSADRIAVTASQPVEGLEAYGHLAAGLMSMMQASKARCLMVTSPNRKAGRTTIAVNLAASFAADGLRVAVIAADSRGGRVDQLLGLQPEPGLTEVLAGSCSLDSTLQPSGVERLSVLAAGAPSGRGVIGYNIDELARLLDRLTRQVDVVVVEAPPVLGSLEAVLLAQEVDLVLVTVDIRRGLRSDASIAVAYLEHVEDRLVGCVANDPGRRPGHRTAVLAPTAGPKPTVGPEPTVGPAPSGSDSSPPPLILRLRHGFGAATRRLGAVAGSAGGRLAAIVQLRGLRHRRWVGAIAIAAIAAVVISTVSWLGYDQSNVRNRTGDPRGAPPADTSGSGRPVVEAALEECRSQWDGQTEPLEAAVSSLAQWQTHIDAMNQLVAKEITLDQANMFWEQTRAGAAEKVERFLEADRAYADANHSCTRPAGIRDAEAERVGLTACRHDVGEREETLDAARLTLETWHHHVVDMNLLRDGEITPERALQLWSKFWEQGSAELRDYRSQLQQTGGHEAC
jgi:Mrp family chromosome partitioning ATPase